MIWVLPVDYTAEAVLTMHELRDDIRLLWGNIKFSIEHCLGFSVVWNDATGESVDPLVMVQVCQKLNSVNFNRINLIDKIRYFKFSWPSLCALIRVGIGIPSSG